MAKWEMAVGAIFIAAILDVLDGRLARFLGSASSFGAELDSLSDLVSFGVAPAILLYLHSLHQWKGMGWAICLFFVVCGALRLARFNTNLTQDSPLSGNFFTGVPITIGASLSMIPLMMDFISTSPWVATPETNGVSLTVLGFLMISRIPTFSLKKVHVSQQWVIPMLIGVALLGAAVVNAPWLTLIVAGTLYSVLIPVSAWKANQVLKNYAESERRAAPEGSDKRTTRPVLSKIK
jgi:CDP-diacylglycerol--serine O-phosphatidyltransferase